MDKESARPVLTKRTSSSMFKPQEAESDPGHFVLESCQYPTPRETLGSSLGLGVNYGFGQWLSSEDDEEDDHASSEETESGKEARPKRKSPSRRSSSLLSTSERRKSRSLTTSSPDSEFFKSMSIALDGEEHMIKAPMTDELRVALFRTLYNAKLHSKQQTEEDTSDCDSALGGSLHSEEFINLLSGSLDSDSVLSRRSSLASCDLSDCDSDAGYQGNTSMSEVDISFEVAGDASYDDVYSSSIN